MRRPLSKRDCSQEIGDEGLVGDGPGGLVSQGVEDVERLVQLLVHVEDGGDVSASVAVVGRGPDGNQVLVSEPVLETVHDQLMGSGDQVDVVDVVEFLSDLRAKEPACASGGHGPGLDVLRVGPHEVAEGTFVGDLHSAVDESDLVDGLDLGGEATVDAENFSLHNSSNAEVVEDFSAVFPGVGVAILPDRLVVEAVDRGDLPRLVVSSQESDVCGVLELQTEEELEGLHGVEASVDEVTHENVPRVWDLSSLVKELEQVVELSVDVSADGDGSLDRLDVALLNEDLLDLLAENSELSLG
mmetsp:Transcript_2693/g.4548  ORF Transcript_2693/g.4548 Transcript_2693/m.4548 type:complete len:300 (-) Transcript_2693:74-973(-)